MRTPATASSSDAVQAQLSRLDPEAALYLRDVIRGLEAEAGTARALVVRAEVRAVRAEERADRASARQAALEAERDAAQGAAGELSAENVALRSRVEELESALARQRGRRRP